MDMCESKNQAVQIKYQGHIKLWLLKRVYQSIAYLMKSIKLVNHKPIYPSNDQNWS